MLKALLRERHLQNYGMFKRAYQRAAQTLDKNLVRTYPSEPTFRRWLAGKTTLPHAEHCAVLEAMLPGWTASELFQRTHRQVRNANTDVEHVTATADPTGSESSSDDAVERSTPTHPALSQDEKHNSDIESVLMDAADESTDYLAWIEATNVGDLTIEQIHDELHSIAQNYLRVPTLLLFTRARRLRNRSFSLLSGHQKPAHTRDLYSAAGWSLTILAWISIDLGRQQAAEEHLRTAWLCADNADHNNLRAWIRATQHTAAFWQEDFTRAGRYAEDGLHYATTGSTELFLTSALALDRARSGDHEAARCIVAHARNTAERARNHTDDLGGPFTCSTERAGGFWSDTQLNIGEAADALTSANNAISAFEMTASDRRNIGSERMVRCQQVKALLMLGELDSAWDSLIPVLETAPEHRMKPLIRRVDEIGDLAANTRWRGTTAANQIDEAIIDFRKEFEHRFLPSRTENGALD